MLPDAMKSLGASATGETPAAIDDVYALVADLERYPTWYPSAVKGAEVLERDADGVPTRMKMTLHASVGPINRDFRIHANIERHPPDRVEMQRLPKGSSDREEMSVAWRLSPGSGGAGTHVQVDLAANLSIPALVPTGGLADGLARGFLGAALAELARG
jgi:ribosome-associated toxin RatA of RatAB toxin-antitoxin module